MPEPTTPTWSITCDGCGITFTSDLAAVQSEAMRHHCDPVKSLLLRLVVSWDSSEEDDDWESKMNAAVADAKRLLGLDNGSSQEQS